MTQPSGSHLSDAEVAELKTVQQDGDTGRPVKIVWTDSGLSVHVGWQKFSAASAEVTRVMDVETVGLWMGENEHVVMVAHSRDADNENWNVAMVIYKPCIVSKEWLA